MDKATVIREILKRRAAFERNGVRHVYLFGSVLRGEAGEESDVDLFFEQDIERFNLFDYAGLKQLAGDLLPFPVDFIERSCLHPKLKDRIEASAERVF